MVAESTPTGVTRRCVSRARFVSADTPTFLGLQASGDSRHAVTNSVIQRLAEGSVLLHGIREDEDTISPH